MIKPNRYLSRLLALLILFAVSSCESHNYFWATKFTFQKDIVASDRKFIVESFNPNLKAEEILISPDNPIRKNCGAVGICISKRNIFVGSYYKGRIKGDKKVILEGVTFDKYLAEAKKHEEDKFIIHKNTVEWISNKYTQSQREQRLEMWGFGKFYAEVDSSLNDDKFATNPNEKIFNEFKERIPEDWFNCTEDSECIITVGPCGFPLIWNRKFTDKEIPKSSKPEIRTCLDFVGPRWPIKAACTNGSCTAVWN